MLPNIPIDYMLIIFPPFFTFFIGVGIGKKLALQKNTKVGIE